MPYVHEHPEWPDLVWRQEVLADVLAAVRFRQGQHLGKMASLGFDLRSAASLESLTDEVLKSSAIEGERLNAAEVRSSVARRLGLEVAGLPNPSRSVEGVVEMMLDATQNFDAPLSVDRLFGWHAALFPTGRSGMHRIVVGAWRNDCDGPMRIVSGLGDGDNAPPEPQPADTAEERVHFEAPAAHRLDVEMSRFLDWFNRTGHPPGGPSLDPVLKAGVAHFWFVTIHPFADGNGRIARAIADLQLARADGTKDRFYSMSSAIERERDTYYHELETAQRGRLDITGWLQWFLGCLDRSIAQADETLRSILNKASLWQQIGTHPVHDRQRKVINCLLDGFEGALTTSKYAKLAKCSTDTALRDIQDLVERGILVKNQAGGRSTSYRLVDPELGPRDELPNPVPPRD
ncbi:MAG: Fic family protein [Candidatus Eisenbacteria bacterium]|uniref:Fic family protein n=1 Tax=Eiseniibacteriota bacterium TaxID=2212470 RepID=A0A956RN73_UNCEI|nr:Fic family protein [Candidatus Eisenbacteria bacterium]